MRELAKIRIAIMNSHEMILSITSETKMSQLSKIKGKRCNSKCQWDKQVHRQVVPLEKMDSTNHSGRSDYEFNLFLDLAPSPAKIKKTSKIRKSSKSKTKLPESEQLFEEPLFPWAEELQKRVDSYHALSTTYLLKRNYMTMNLFISLTLKIPSLSFIFLIIVTFKFQTWLKESFHCEFIIAILSFASSLIVSYIY